MSSLKSKSPVRIANEVMNQLELVPYIPPTNEIDYSIVEYSGKADSNMKQEIEEYAKGQGRNSSNFFKGLIYDKDLDLIDIMSNIDFILELQNKYDLRLLNLPA